MYKQEFTLFAILLFVFALILTALGGWSDMMGRPFLVTKQHAWNDGIFLMLAGIFFLLLARV